MKKSVFHCPAINASAGQKNAFSFCTGGKEYVENGTIAG